MGRLLVFMARILQDDWAKQVRAIAVEENVAFLLEPDGSGKVVGEGSAYFLEAKHPPEICKHNEPLKFDGISVRRVGDKGTFNVKTWSGNDGDSVFAFDAGRQGHAELVRITEFIDFDRLSGRDRARDQKRNEKPATICALLCHSPNMCVPR